MPTKPTGNPRGRPPGVKNKPKTIEEFILLQTTAPKAPPPRKPRMAPRGPWAGLNETERQALSAKLIAARKGRVGLRNPKTAGRSRTLSDAQFLQMQAEAQPEIKRIIKKMKAAGQIEDPRAEEVLTKALTVFKTSTTAKDVTALGRLILDFTKAKPAAKLDVSVRSHEDFLDELDEASNTE